MQDWLLLPGNKALLFTPRTGSTATARAILTAHYPEKLSFTGWRLPPGVSEPPLQRVVPNGQPAPDAALAVVLRDPVERFRSACARANITAAEGLAQLSQGHGTAIAMLAPVSNLLRNTDRGCITFFRFPDELGSLAEWLGTGPIGPENASDPGTKPDLTPDELAAVETAYAEDIELFTNPPQPESPPVPVREIPKLVLMRRLEALGKWEQFKALLAAQPTLDDAFWLAQTLMTDDPLFVQYAPVLKAQLEMTDEQFDALLS